MTVSGHKSIESINSYVPKTSNKKKREMSNSLADAMIKSPKHMKSSNTVTTDQVSNRNPAQNQFQMSFKDFWNWMKKVNKSF